YAALSYCWGSSPPFTTKLSTLNSRIQGFPMAELPLTLRETVQVTRDLGLRYLWIGSLCILQRSQDYIAAKFSARMHKVYGQAFLTIVAAEA
ncbi:heterokaryon incompatibility, partial [Hyaloscypha hepaticicola]